MLRSTHAKVSLDNRICRTSTFIPILVEGLRIVKEALKSANNMSANRNQQRSQFMGILAGYEKLACKPRDRLVDTARESLLTKEVLLSIGERWVRLDEVLEEYHDTLNDNRDEETHLMCFEVRLHGWFRIEE